jgi:hypothetical protein
MVVERESVGNPHEVALEGKPSNDVMALANERDQYASSGRHDRVIAVDEQLALRGYVVNTKGDLVGLDKDRRAAHQDPKAAEKEADKLERAAERAEDKAEDAKAKATDAEKLAAEKAEAAKKARLDQTVAQQKAAGDDDEDGKDKPKLTAKERAQPPKERAVPLD